MKLPYTWFKLSSGTSLQVYDILNKKVRLAFYKGRGAFNTMFPPRSSNVHRSLSFFNPIQSYGAFKDEFSITLTPHESVFVTLKL